MTTNSLPAVAIAGCGAICAVGSGVEALKSALHGNASGLHPSQRFDHQRYQSSVVGAVDPNRGAHLDTTTIADKGFPLPTTKEWGEGKGEG